MNTRTDRQPADRAPFEPGWYECWAPDGMDPKPKPKPKPE